MKPKVHIDGHNGSTGLKIRELLASRDDLTLSTLPDALRKDPDARQAVLRQSDLAILCLPDIAAKQAIDWLEGSDTRVIDASSVHRVSPGWTYGIPELPGQREIIRNAQRVANPGCYPTSVILFMRPLIDAGLVMPDAPIVVHALSGYSGGGRPLIEHWEASDNRLNSLSFEAPYGLDRVHKHVPEMKKYGRLKTDPQFVPAVGPFRCGMRVQIPLHTNLLGDTDATAIWNVLNERYRDETFVTVAPLGGPAEKDEFSFDPQRCNNTNRIELLVLPHQSGHVLLMAILDNLGKGASGAAVQNLNLMLGCDEATGLRN
jgi:N-acetyl-gamma-glutamyl-phosphate reductase